MIYPGLKATGFCLNLHSFLLKHLEAVYSAEKQQQNKTKHTPNTLFSPWTHSFPTGKKLGESTRLVHPLGHGLGVAFVVLGCLSNTAVTQICEVRYVIVK